METPKLQIERLPADAIDVGTRIRAPRAELDRAFVKSIQRSGIIQPLIVTPNGEGRFWLLAGQRRLLHARAAGLQSVPVRVLDPVSEKRGLEIEIGENTFREDFDPLDKARAFARRAADGQTQTETAGWWVQLTGEKISRSSVAQHLKLLYLSSEAQAALHDGALDFTVARHLAYGDLAAHTAEIIAEAYRRLDRDGKPASWKSLALYARQFQTDGELLQQHDAMEAAALPAIVSTPPTVQPAQHNPGTMLPLALCISVVERGVEMLEKNNAALSLEERDALKALASRLQTIGECHE